MKYFIDCEFIEGFHKPLFGKRRHFIDLIYIGIVCEDGRTYSAISNEYNYNNADAWVKKSVILPLYIDTIYGDSRNRCNENNFHKIYGKSNTQIAKEIIDFIYELEYPSAQTLIEQAFSKVGKISPEFYGYYSDYDWVLFCSLFGRMIDLPTGFPMYCKDLKQNIDENVKQLSDEYFTIRFGVQDKTTFEQRIALIKASKDYPVQKDEHNALADAKWNYELYKFLNTL